MTTPDELRVQRDHYRDLMAHLEAENARLWDAIRNLRVIANECLASWGNEHIGNTLLATLPTEPEL